MPKLTEDDIAIAKAIVNCCGEASKLAMVRDYGAEADNISADEVNCASAVMVDKLDDIINTSTDDALVCVAKELREQVGSSTPTDSGLGIIKSSILVMRHSSQSLSVDGIIAKFCQDIHATFNKLRVELTEEEAIAKEFN